MCEPVLAGTVSGKGREEDRRRKVEVFADVEEGTKTFVKSKA